MRSTRPEREDSVATYAEHSRRTQRALLDAGRTLFTDLDYAHTTIEQIARRAGVTVGAFHHHYPEKTALFAAVFDEVCQEYVHAVQTHMQMAEGDTWERFMASLEVWLEQVEHPSVWRIVYADAPTVLDWAGVRRRAPDFRFLHTVLARLRAEGVIQPLPLDPCVHVVWAMCATAARYIAQAQKRTVARQEMTVTLGRLLDGLRRM